MDNRIEKFLKEQDRIIDEDRQNTLISLGLTEKEFSPDGKQSHYYPDCTYVDGEKRYYREVAMTVSDEEYALIVSKAEQAEAIRLKNEQQKNSVNSRLTVKKWLPVFEAPKDGSVQNEQPETGKSKIASYLRICAWVICVLLGFVGIVVSIEAESILNILVYALGATLEVLMLYYYAEVLDSLAELKAIAKGGFKYSETRKK